MKEQILKEFAAEQKIKNLENFINFLYAKIENEEPEDINDMKKYDIVMAQLDVLNIIKDYMNI